jgi:hypothetical protein
VKKLRALTALLGVSVLLVGVVLPALFSSDVYAANITSRSLTLQPGTTDGGSKPGGTVNHLFTFTLPSATTIHSIKFQYCTTADIDIDGGLCTTPHGLTTTGATLGTTGGEAAGFDTLHATGTNGSPYLSSTSGVNPGGSTSSTIQLLGVVNQDVNAANCGGAANCTFFVRITTYTSSDATGTPVDAGTVAASTSTQIVLTGTMPESLIFCTGATVAENGGGIPDCSTATPGDITFNQLFDPTATAYATSQMSASTNANSGYSITVEGATLTSGSNTIPAMTSAATSSTGTGQFGLNLVKNADFCGASCDVGNDIAPASNGTNLMGAASSGFNTGGTFKFSPGSPNVVAASDSGGSAAPTDPQIYTASYIVNVSGSQPAGTYVTTLTYICTPTF